MADWWQIVEKISKKGEHLLYLTSIGKGRNCSIQLIHYRRFMQLLKRSCCICCLFFIHFSLAEPHESLEWILDEHLHLRGRALPQSFSQQILAPYLASGAHLLLLRHAIIYPFDQGNVAVGSRVLGGLLVGQFALLLDLLDELDASSDGDGHGSFSMILRPALDEQFGVGEGIDPGVVEELTGAILAHNLETSVLADATELVATR